jgi:hypothetical protein
MKKPFFMMFFLVFLGSLVFGNTGEQEEVDFLLFLPNSAGQFVNHDQAMTQLDDTAEFLIKKNLSAGQISVYGYAANVANDIDSISLSRDRALFVINELQKRGLSGDLFADPVAHGSADEWGDNADEKDRSLNRRVRILVEGAALSPAIMRADEPAIEPPPVIWEEPILQEEQIQQEEAVEESPSQFPWWLLLLLLLALIAAVLLFLVFKRKKNPADEPAPRVPPVQKAAESVAVEPQVAFVKPIRILEEEEIRRYSFGLFERRHGLNGDAIGDWYQAVSELTAYYEAQGYQVMLYWEVPNA